MSGGPSFAPEVRHIHASHWSVVAQAKHDAQQARSRANLREFIFLDLASQAVTMYVRQQHAAKSAKRGLV